VAAGDLERQARRPHVDPPVSRRSSLKALATSSNRCRTRSTGSAAGPFRSDRRGGTTSPADSALTAPGHGSAWIEQSCKSAFSTFLGCTGRGTRCARTIISDAFAPVRTGLIGRTLAQPAVFVKAPAAALSCRSASTFSPHSGSSPLGASSLLARGVTHWLRTGHRTVTREAENRP
jgi:hypothetical protein